MSFLPFLHSVAAGRDLTSDEAEQAMTMVLGGLVSSALLAGFLVALRMKGETAVELEGFARAMRHAATPVDAGDGAPLIDTCGTGGDGLESFNISTVAALVVAGAGVRVAKHGNRSVSSACGSADLMEALGVHVTAAPAVMAACIRQAGIGFLFAPALHPAMRHAQPTRVELKMRTVFNLLGPLTNPARAPFQLIGAPSPGSAERIAQALANLGLERGFVVHGSDGLDEITTTGETLAFEVRGRHIRRHTFTPLQFGVDRASPDLLRGGGRERNAQIAEAILDGEPGPKRDIVLVNASAALVAAGAARGFREGVELARQSIDSGAARDRLRALVHHSRVVP